MANDLQQTGDNLPAKRRLKRRHVDMICLIVHKGLSFHDAARNVGYSEAQYYRLVKDPLVLERLAEERQVLLKSEQPRNIHALIDVRDNSPNSLARVQAVKALEDMQDSSPGQPPGQQVGYVIHIIGAQQPQPTNLPTIDHNSLINNNGVHIDRRNAADVEPDGVDELASTPPRRPPQTRPGGGGGARSLAALREGGGGKNRPPPKSS